MRAVRTLSHLTQRREVAKIELQNFASSRHCVIFSSATAVPLREHFEHQSKAIII